MSQMLGSSISNAVNSPHGAALAGATGAIAGSVHSGKTTAASVIATGVSAAIGFAVSRVAGPGIGALTGAYAQEMISVFLEGHTSHVPVSPSDIDSDLYGHALAAFEARLRNAVDFTTARDLAAGARCFPAFTPVLLADGTHKPICDIRVGDQVMAFDTFGG
jgi:hypothetical protein